MAKAFFFDWFNTLADYEPPRNRLYCQAFKELGIEIPLDKATRGVVLGDECVYSENLRFPLAKRSPEERFEVYLAFPRMILSEAKIEATHEVLAQVRNRIRELFKPEEQVFVLFPDVLPNMKKLKEMGFTLGVHPEGSTRRVLPEGLKLGVVTNLRDDMNPVVFKLGLKPYLDVLLTSEIAGVPKPNPGIFQKACEMVGVKPEEAIYVGDQHQIDVQGARRAGLKPVLIDRCDLYSHVTDCPRIKTLDEIYQHL